MSRTDRRVARTANTSHRRRPASVVLSVVAATVMFAGVCLTFLMNTPVLQNPDELFQFDRVMAAEHGHLAPDPASINLSQGSAATQNSLEPKPIPKLSLLQRFGVAKAPAREARKSYQQLGGDRRTSSRHVPNYLTQHPPLYYDLLGAVTWVLPGADSMPVDRLMWILKFLDILIVLPLPYLMYRSARTLVGDNAVARAAAFLPLLVPGLAHSAGSINNDNLAVTVGAAVVALSLAVARGDRSTRTAIWLSALCVAGALTKATVLFVLVIVPIAYLVNIVRARRLPGRAVLATLALGALGSAAWWVRNVIAFGRFQPDGYGSNITAVMVNPRPPGQQAPLAPFLSAAKDQVTRRFWAGLGLGGPPYLPEVMIWTLTLVTLAAAVVAVAALRGRRIEVLLAFAVGIAAVAMIFFQSYRHWLHYDAIRQLQGRYAYPGVFGIVFPWTVACALLLRRWWRWTPVVIALIGSMVSGWAIYTSADYFWLPPGEALQPGSWGSAISQLLSWDALTPWLGVTALVLAALCWLGGAVLAGWAAIRDTDHRPLREALRDPEPAAA